MNAPTTIDKTPQKRYNDRAMNVLYFDTETTGLSPTGAYVDGHMYPGQICQLAYVVDNGHVLVPKNFYFEVQYIDPGASRVTGLTVETVKYLSGGRRFADDVDEIKRDFDCADKIVAHNLSFDQKFMQAEMARCGYSFDIGGRGVCTMRSFTSVLRLPARRYGYKSPSLEELAHYYGIDDTAIYNELRWLYDVSKDAHDARHDTVKMYLTVQKAIRTDPALAVLFGGNQTLAE